MLWEGTYGGALEVAIASVAINHNIYIYDLSLNKLGEFEELQRNSSIHLLYHLYHYSLIIDYTPTS
jgi:hypothetical protein